ncbi:unnamed protein product [Acanthoscelides obtectus]|uniref:Uncharacterized protein n=1 Tax=Acanthoscelides obtectus TaxID=200917 RepID=A0A9P0P3Q7_ACAOB|nr:unnamed protein product [Acanthoscelides obtectus]CAK1665915.1 hypothetical protein AOBTE_LOCUS25046 [Acanthoscelides obtectus]
MLLSSNIVRNRQNKTTELVKSESNAKRKDKERTATKKITKRNTKIKQLRKRKPSTTETESDSSLDLHLQDDDDDVDDEDSCCVGCGELCSCTKMDVDWIKSISCQRWLYEDCPKYEST